MNISTNHHYIPKFYIKGFTNSKGFLHIYDKQKDEFYENRSPKSIFFEKERNTMYLNEKTSILEDKFYKELDDKCKIAIQNLRDKPNSVELLNTDNIADIQLFILCLFWRIPKTDDAFERFIQEAEILFTTKEGEKVRDEKLEHKLKDDVSYKKMQRAFIFRKAIDGMKNSQGQLYTQLFGRKDELFLLGDYPVVFKKTPSTFDDLIHKDYYLPISSNRLFHSSKDEHPLSFDYDKIGRFNVLIIDQSVRYICSPNLDCLKRSVAFYKKIKATNLFHELIGKVFNY